jgi:nucleotide-binding universal stress UspA family protein
MRKILVGVDLSEQSETAVGHAVELARPGGAEVVLVLVDAIPEMVEPFPPSASATVQTYVHTLKDRLAADRAGLAELRQRWVGRGVEISQLVVDGYADDELVKTAAETGADVLVVGSHGRTGLKRLLIGSVAERVVRLAECSVLVARGPAPSDGYRRIVVGTDFSALADRAFVRALELARPGGRIDLVHCWQMTPILTPPDAPAMIPSYDAIRADIRDELAERGKAAVARGPAGLDVHFHLLERPAAHGLDDFAREVNAELIVVGSHGRRGLRRFLLGSIAEVTVRHASCSVLVAR